MKNWRTTISGLLAALLPWAKQVDPKRAGLYDTLATAALGVFAYMAKDYHVSGTGKPGEA